MKRANASSDSNSGGSINNHKSLLHSEIILTVFIPLLVVVSALLFKFAFNFHMDSDPIWSIGVGEWINTHRAVPHVDVFSWTVADEQWSSNSWLFCWLMYLADQSMGYLGIALINFIPTLFAGYFVYLISVMMHKNNLKISSSEMLSMS